MLQLENQTVVFDLKVAKTKVAILEERLAGIEVGATERKADRSVTPRPGNINIVVNSSSYGCFGLGSFS